MFERYGNVKPVETQFLPFVVLALPVGVWADRLDRKTILIASDLVRMACQVVAAVLLLGGGATVPALVVIAAKYGAADAFFVQGSQSA